MAIIKSHLYKSYTTIVTLEYYAWLVGYSECAMYGVFNPDDHVIDECRDIWTLPQRNYVLRYFNEAQEELENQTRRLFSPTWITGDLNDTGNSRLTDIQLCKTAYNTKWNNLIQMGRKVISEVELDSVVDHTGDPALIGPITVDTAVITDINYLRVYYPDTEIEINPSSIYFVGSDLYIEIPRCRMVRFDLRDNNTSGVLYTDTSNFQQTVDIKYLYTEDYNSIVDNNDGTVGLFYHAGEIVPTEQQIDIVVRLAHSKMPEEPCGCNISQRLWKRDREVPQFLTGERLNCPFGLSDGAWIAYKWAQTLNKPIFGHM